jgi:flagellar basal-body rod protein FlgB
VPDFGDVTMTALQSALDGLAARQRTTADNLANVSTPGFTAKRVNFEDALRAALSDGSDPSVAPETLLSTDAARSDGNNVNVDSETLSMVDSGLRYQLAIQALNSKFGLLRTAIGGTN